MGVLNDLQVIRVENGFLVMDYQPSAPMFHSKKWVAKDSSELSILVKTLVDGGMAENPFMDKVSEDPCQTTKT